MLRDMRMGTIMLKYRMAHDYAWLWSSAKIICIVLISPLVGALINPGGETTADEYAVPANFRG